MLKFPTISIVMAYYNRRNLVERTILSILQSKYRHAAEVIIVDDGSTEDQRIEFLEHLGLNLKVIRVEPQNKTWHNPCIPYNIGFRHAAGNIVIIQNPECIHVGDVLKSAVNNVSDGTYVVFACYSIDSQVLEKLMSVDLTSDDYDSKIIEAINPINKRASGDCSNGWYTHPKYFARTLHFCSAITRKDLRDLKGFDEKYAQGIAFEDLEFSRRVRGSMRIQWVVEPFVVHQSHEPTDYTNKQELFLINKAIFEKG